MTRNNIDIHTYNANMSPEANIEVAILVEDFAYIQATRANVCSIFQEINQKLMSLNIIYLDVVKNHTIKDYTFGLDAFYFQSKLIEYEYEDMKKLLNIITNRFYCEYYKLYKIITDYIHNEAKLSNIVLNKTTFPVYKDLDKGINYDFKLTIDIQAIIVQYINELNIFLSSKNAELNTNNRKQTTMGINIEHIVHFQSFTNALLEEQIMMFIRYVDTLNKHHTKYINRLYFISKALIDDVNEEITTNTEEEEDFVKNEMIDEFQFESTTFDNASIMFDPVFANDFTFSPIDQEPITVDTDNFKPVDDSVGDNDNIIISEV